MSNWIIVLTTVLPQEAHMAKTYLESFGIDVFIRDELTAQVDNFCSNAIGGVKLLVHESNFDKSIEYLKSGGYITEADLLVERDIQKVKFAKNMDKTVCLFCKSKNIGKVREPNFLILITFFLLGILFPLFKRSYKCFECDKEWKFIK